MAAGGCLGFTAATLHDVDVLLQANMDVLLSNQFVGDAAIQRLVYAAGCSAADSDYDDLDVVHAVAEGIVKRPAPHARGVARRLPGCHAALLWFFVELVEIEQVVEVFQVL
jgi:hypothetical protein